MPDSSQNAGKTHDPAGGTRRMDFECIDALLDLPEFRVTDQVIRPHELELHIERRDTYLVCPRCQGCCERIKDGRARCSRDLPMLERPVTLQLHVRRFKCSDCHHRPWEKSETFGDRVKWTKRLYDQVRQEFLHGCPCQELARRYGLSARTVFRWTFERSRGGRPRKLGRVLGIDEYTRRKGHRHNTIIVDLDKGRPITTFKGRGVEDVVKWFQSRPQAELDGDEVIARADWRRRFPELREVIDWVQDLRQWFARKYDKPARAALWQLIERARASALAPLQNVGGTLSRWVEPIARYIRQRYTNGMTEGFNNKIKLIQRRAFGLRNEHNRKKRILADCGKT